MTSHNDLRTWRHKRKVRFLLERQTSARTTPRTRPFITLRHDRHIWTDRNSLTGIDRQWVRWKFGKVFLHKLPLKSIQNVWIAIINDNNNFASSLFRSLWEFVGDCFGPRYFSSGAHSEKYLSPKQSLPISHNDLQKDGAQLLLSKWTVL